MKRFAFLLMLLLLWGLAIMNSSCSKQNIEPTPTIMWENSTADTIIISVNGTHAIIGLFPYQVRLVGNDSWLNNTYSVIDGTAKQFQITKRNTITP